MFTEPEKTEITQFLNNMPTNSSIYIGADSVRFSRTNKASGVKEWFARYTVAFIIHLGSKHGGKIFHTTEVERVYGSVEKPRLRLMTEVYKAVAVYLEFAELLEDLPVEIHLDINPDPKHKSSVVLREALGYVKGMTGLDGFVKPKSFAASHAGDRGCRGLLDS